MIIEKKEIASICKLVESGINLIVAGGMTEIEFSTPIIIPDVHTGWSTLFAADISLKAVTDWSNTPQTIIINISGITGELNVVAEDGEMLWTPLSPLTDRVEKAVNEIVSSAEMA